MTRIMSAHGPPCLSLQSSALPPLLVGYLVISGLDPLAFVWNPQDLRCQGPNQIHLSLKSRRDSLTAFPDRPVGAAVGPLENRTSFMSQDAR